MINRMKAKLEERGQECSELVSGLALKEESCGNLAAEVQHLKAELEKSTSTLHHQVHTNKTLTLEIGQRSDQLESLQLTLTQRDDRISELNSQLSAVTHRVDQVDAELSAKQLQLDELTVQLAGQSTSTNDRSLDSEPTDPEPSEEDLQSPRDSNSSITEVQELKTQLAELQELLAQKVLLINELQGSFIALLLCSNMVAKCLLYY